MKLHNIMRDPTRQGDPFSITFVDDSGKYHSTLFSHGESPEQLILTLKGFQRREEEKNA